MTKLQLEYLKYSENQRANKASEALTALRDNRAYFVNLGTLNENIRSNQERERQGLISLAETERSHRANEQISLDSLEETKRANREREAQGRLSLELTSARDSESARHNLATESLDSRRIDVTQAHYAEQDAYTKAHYERSDANTLRDINNRAWYNAQNIQLGYANLAEQNRHYVAMETETNRSNRTNELIKGLQMANTKNIADADRQNAYKMNEARIAQTMYDNSAQRQIDLKLGLSNLNLRQKELDQKYTDMWVNAAVDVHSSMSRMAGSMMSSAASIIPLF